MTEIIPYAPRHMPAAAEHWRALTTTERIDEYTRLLPVAVCETALAELETLPPVATREGAATLASLVIGSYPSTRHVGDPAIYSRAITSLFEEHSPEVGRQAADAITRTCKFLPSRAEVAEALEAVEDKRRAAAYVARAMIREHERRLEKQRIEREREQDKADGVVLDFGQILKQAGVKSRRTDDGRA